MGSHHDQFIYETYRMYGWLID